jgi:hypothetical protein
MIGRLLRRRFLHRWTIGRVGLELIFEPRDLWLGVYWTTTDGALTGERWAMVYVCIVPCLPLRLSWWLGFYDGGGS